MSKFVDFVPDSEVRAIMEAILTRFREIFEGFDLAKVGFVKTKKKGNQPIKVHRVPYPYNVWISAVYIFEIFSGCWNSMDQPSRNKVVFKYMCSIPPGGFDDQSNSFGKILKPEIKMFLREFAASGGVPNWEENPNVADPMTLTVSSIKASMPRVDALPPPDGISRRAITSNDVADIVPDAPKVQ
jgi:hypothetical protein